MGELSQYINQISILCDSNRVKSLYVFGSVANEKFRPDSDIDLVVEIEDKDPLSYSDHYFNLKFALEQILKRHIDLLEEKAIKTHI